MLSHRYNYFTKIPTMKVGLVLDDNISRPGGVQKYILGLNNFLQSQGHGVKIITGGKNFPAGLSNVITFGTSFSVQANSNTTSIPLPVSKNQILKILDQENFDILHFAAPFSPTMGERILAFSRAINIASFLIYTEKNSLWNWLSPLLSVLQRRHLKKLHGRIAISKAALACAQVFSPGIYELIPPGIDIKKFNPQVQPLPHLHNVSSNLLFVGRLEKRKGLNYLLEVFKNLKPRIPQLRLLIAGQGPEYKPLKKLVDFWRLPDVEFLGFVPEEVLPHLYCSSTIFVSPATQGESFGIVLLEAMASGLPIVAFDNRGYKETLNFAPQEDFVVENKNVQALSLALEALLVNPDLRKKVSEANLKQAQKYSWEKIGKQILSLYRACQEKVFSQRKENHSSPTTVT